MAHRALALLAGLALLALAVPGRAVPPGPAPIPQILISTSAFSGDNRGNSDFDEISIQSDFGGIAGTLHSGIPSTAAGGFVSGFGGGAPAVFISCEASSANAVTTSEFRSLLREDYFFYVAPVAGSSPTSTVVPLLFSYTISLRLESTSLPFQADATGGITAPAFGFPFEFIQLTPGNPALAAVVDSDTLAGSVPVDLWQSVRLEANVNLIVDGEGIVASCLAEVTR